MYRQHSNGIRMLFVCVIEECGFVKSNKKFARAERSGDLIATPLICLYITSLKSRVRERVQKQH